MFTLLCKPYINLKKKNYDVSFQNEIDRDNEPGKKYNRTRIIDIS